MEEQAGDLSQKHEPQPNQPPPKVDRAVIISGFVMISMCLFVVALGIFAHNGEWTITNYLLMGFGGLTTIFFLVAWLAGLGILDQKKVQNRFEKIAAIGSVFGDKLSTVIAYAIMGGFVCLGLYGLAQLFNAVAALPVGILITIVIFILLFKK